MNGPRLAVGRLSQWWHKATKLIKNNSNTWYRSTEHRHPSWYSTTVPHAAEENCSTAAWTALFSSWRELFASWRALFASWRELFESYNKSVRGTNNYVSQLKELFASWKNCSPAERTVGQLSILFASWISTVYGNARLINPEQKKMHRRAKSDLAYSEVIRRDNKNCELVQFCFSAAVRWCVQINITRTLKCIVCVLLMGN